VISARKDDHEDCAGKVEVAGIRKSISHQMRSRTWR
jgi:hypothetical protein